MLLEVSHVSKTFSSGFFLKTKRQALRDVSLILKEGEMLGLAGESGAGKSTLLRIIMGLTKPDEGYASLDGRQIDAMTEREKSDMRASLQILFQNPSSALNPRMKIQESFMEPAKIHGLPCKEAEEVMELLQLRKELLDRYPHQLSGGELQRICLGRLLLMRPKCLLLDEPTSMLDVSVQAQIVDVLRQVQRQTGMSCLFISHDLDVLRSCCERIGILYGGRLIETAETEELYAHPREEYTKQLIGAFQNF